MDAEHERAQRPGREIVVRDAAGQLVGQAPARPVRILGQGLEFRVTTVDGQTLHIQLPRPGARPPGMNPPSPTRFPINLAWMLALVAVAVALGTYPIVRRLTQRLEAVQDGVRQWGDGNLALRLPEDGSDEVASLARGFDAPCRLLRCPDQHPR
jgi:methyl-accepting chemotaxis protein